MSRDYSYYETHWTECACGDAAYQAGKSLADNPHLADRAGSLFDEGWQTGWKSAAYDDVYAEVIRLKQLLAQPCVHELARKYAESCGTRFDDIFLDQKVYEAEIADVVLEDDRRPE